MEQSAKEEAEYQKISWDTGCFNFLLTRTKTKFTHKSNFKRRLNIEKQLAIKLPAITDEMLKSLYELACQKYIRKCKSLYEVSSGFGKTKSEHMFLDTISEIIRLNPKLKNLEVYPSMQFSKDFPKDFKMVVGNYVPDFLVFGLKTNGSSAVSFEINGDSHIEKWRKDDLRNRHFGELNIFTVEIPNDQVKDIQFITKALLEMYRARNGSLNHQVLRCKRLIWTKTISCHLSLAEIEDHALSIYGVQLYLINEAIEYSKQPDCPRNIKQELRYLKI
ncbi:MAG: hypothetical protein V4654_14140 [Bdellovibrionota bacterium]